MGCLPISCPYGTAYFHNGLLSNLTSPRLKLVRAYALGMVQLYGLFPFLEQGKEGSDAAGAGGGRRSSWNFLQLVSATPSKDA